MNATHPDIEVWRGALLSGGTRFLLEAARNYLGPLKTPYNKHDLVEKLEGFLRSPDNAEAIAAFLDDEDRRILAALAVLGPRSEADLAAVLAPEGEGVERRVAGARIASLRERLVLFRTGSGPDGPIAAAPPLLDLLAGLADPAILFGGRPYAAAPKPAWLDAGEACVAAAVLAREPHAFGRADKVGARVRKKILAFAPELAERVEPGPRGSTRDRLDVLALAFRGAGFLTGAAEESAFAPAVFRAAAEAGDQALLERLLAGLALADGAFGEDGADLEVAAAFCGAFLEAPAPGLAYPREGIERLAMAAAARAGLELAPSLFVGAMLAFGVLGRNGAGVAVASHPVSIGPGRGPGSSLALEASMEFRVLPGADARTLCLAALAGRLEHRDRAWTLRLDRGSVAAAFESGLDAPSLIARFEEATGRPLPQGAAFNLEAWERERRSLRLYRGIAIAAAGPAAAVLGAAPSFAGLGLERLAEGVWFVPEERLREVLDAFSRAGLPSPSISGGPANPFRTPIREAGPFREGALAPPAIRAAVAGLRNLADAASSARAYDAVDAEARLAALKEALDGFEAPLERKRELAERIARRLILSAEQLRRADPAPERVEAGALDYVGKSRTVERILRSRYDLLELLPSGADPGAARQLVRPLELRRRGDGMELRAVHEDGSDHPVGTRFDASLAALGAMRRVRILFFGDDDEREF